MKIRYRVELIKFNPISKEAEAYKSFYFESAKNIDNAMKMLKSAVEAGKTEKILTKGSKNGRKQ